MNDLQGSEKSEAIMSAISSFKKRLDSKEPTIKEKSGIDLVSIVEKLARNRSRKAKK